MPAAPHYDEPSKGYFFVSAICHGIILLLFIVGYETATPMAVFENTNKNDIISAVVLGDSATSKILPHAMPAPTPVLKPPQAIAKTQPQPQQMAVQQDVIAIKIATKKKLAEQKALADKMQRELFAKSLLADIQKQTKKQKKLQQKQVAAQFQKTLHEQSEKSLREQMLNEEIKLQGTQSRQAQGEVNKYKALIVQAISEHWTVPPQANKNLYCELMIRVAPGGMVLDVQVTKSSGDPALDSSARVAVLKASPLPVPSNPDAFASFRQFALKVKPENVLG